MLTHDPQQKKLINCTSFKFKTYALQKNYYENAKTSPTGWEKMLINYISDKELVLRIYKEILQFNNKTNNPIKRKRFE